MSTTLQSGDIQSVPSTLPAPLPDIAAQIAALLSAAGIAPLDETGWIRVTGGDRVRWLNGMVTNSIQDLSPGEGCYNFVLNAQGRILGDLTAFALSGSLLLETGSAASIAAHLDRFIIMDDVQLTVIGEPRKGIVVAGPQAAAILNKLGLAMDIHSLRLQSATWKTTPVDILQAYSPIVPRYELWGDSATIAALTSDLITAGATPVSPEAIEQLRILEGTPRYGIDIRNSEIARDLPQETAQTRALHFTKGCYLGQEIVERIRSRGNVHRTFTGFELNGTLPAPGTVLEADGKPVGELTSVAAISLPQSHAGSESQPESTVPRARAAPLQLALGYVRREALERSLILRYPGGTATPIALPYSHP